MEYSAHLKFIELKKSDPESAMLYFASKQPDKRICIRVQINEKGDIVNYNNDRFICDGLEQKGLFEHLFSRDETPRGGSRKSIRVHFWRITNAGLNELAKREIEKHD